MTIELITTTNDGRQYCHQIPNGGTYTVRGDEVSIVTTVIKGDDKPVRRAKGKKKESS